MLGFVKKEYPKHNLIITGDIVDDGDERQYERALKALEEFKGRVFICPGNHDFGPAGNFYSRDRAKMFDEFLSRSFRQGGSFAGDNIPVVNIVKEKGDEVMLIALDSNLETIHPFDFACGEIGDTQLAALDSILTNTACKHMTKILFFHHHAFMHNNPFMELKDARTLMRLIFGRVDVVLFGHKHESNAWSNINGIPFVLSSDNSPGKDYAREVSVSNKQVGVRDIAISDSAKGQ